jgi:hypothetical protein
VAFDLCASDKLKSEKKAHKKCGAFLFFGTKLSYNWKAGRVPFMSSTVTREG